MQEQLQLNKFLEVSTELAFKSCSVVKECSENKQLGVYQKSKNDPVTEADYQIQTIIIKTLQHHFPGLKCIGEQTVEYKGKTKIIDKITPINQIAHLNNSLPYNKLCVWIDPIDCTKGFVDGYIHCVTVLIGISFQKKAYAGIIGIPYIKKDGDFFYEPRVIIGAQNEAFTSQSDRKWIEVQKPSLKLNPIPRIAVSTSRNDKNERQFIEKIKGERVDSGGAGRKVMMVINGQVDAMAYLKPYTCKWDSCAPEAVANALGAYFSDNDGQQLLYDFNYPKMINGKGFFCTFNSELRDSFLSFMAGKI